MGGIPGFENILRYLYDSDMNIVEARKNNFTSFIYGTYFSKTIVFLDLQSDGTWDTDKAFDEFSPINGRGLFEALTFEPVDFEVELAR